MLDSQRARLTSRTSALVAALAAALMVALGVLVSGGTQPTGIDFAISDWVRAVFGGSDTLVSVLALPSNPVVFAAGITLTCAVMARRRDWPHAAFAVAAPLLVVAVNTWLLKPMFGRLHAGYLAYPSGHAVSLTALLTVLVLLSSPGARRSVVIAASVLVVTVAGIGIVGLEFHYPTDIVGGAAFAVAGVLGSAAVLDLLRRRARPPAPAR